MIGYDKMKFDLTKEIGICPGLAQSSPASSVEPVPRTSSWVTQRLGTGIFHKQRRSDKIKIEKLKTYGTFLFLLLQMFDMVWLIKVNTDLTEATEAIFDLFFRRRDNI